MLTRCSQRRQTSPPVSPPGELDETDASYLIQAHSSIMWKMTLSIELDVHNVLHFRQRRAEPRPQVTRTERLVKSGCAVLRHASGQTNRQADRHTDTRIAILPCTTGGKVINNTCFRQFHSGNTLHYETLRTEKRSVVTLLRKYFFCEVCSRRLMHARASAVK